PGSRGGLAQRLARALEECLPQRGSRALEPLLHRVFAKAQQLGDLTDGFALAVIERDDLARLVRQLLHRFREGPPILALDEHASSIGRGIGDCGDVVFPRRMTPSKARPRTKKRMRLVPRQLAKPREEARRIAKLADASPGRDEHVLSDVLARDDVTHDR